MSDLAKLALIGAPLVLTSLLTLSSLLALLPFRLGSHVWSHVTGLHESTSSLVFPWPLTITFKDMV